MLMNAKLGDSDIECHSDSQLDLVRRTGVFLMLGQCDTTGPRLVSYVRKGSSSSWEDHMSCEPCLAETCCRVTTDSRVPRLPSETLTTMAMKIHDPLLMISLFKKNAT